MNAAFQAILGLYSIIIGLGMSKLLEGVRNHVAPGQKLRGSALYVGMLMLGLLVHVTSWLSLWSLRHVEAWGIWSFLFVMTIPLVMYLFSAITVPEHPHSSNMDSYYLRNSTGMHVLLFIAIGFNGLAQPLILGRLSDTTATLGRLAAMALLLVCALSPGAMRVHKVFVPMLVVGIAVLLPFLEFPIK